MTDYLVHIPFGSVSTGTIAEILSEAFRSPSDHSRPSVTCEPVEVYAKLTARIDELEHENAPLTKTVEEHLSTIVKAAGHLNNGRIDNARKVLVVDGSEKPSEPLFEIPAEQAKNIYARSLALIKFLSKRTIIPIAGALLVDDLQRYSAAANPRSPIDNLFQRTANAIRMFDPHGHSFAELLVELDEAAIKHKVPASLAVRPVSFDEAAANTRFCDLVLTLNAHLRNGFVKKAIQELSNAFKDTAYASLSDEQRRLQSEKHAYGELRTDARDAVHDAPSNKVGAGLPPGAPVIGVDPLRPATDPPAFEIVCAGHPSNAHSVREALLAAFGDGTAIGRALLAEKIIIRERVPARDDTRSDLTRDERVVTLVELEEALTSAYGPVTGTETLRTLCQYLPQGHLCRDGDVPRYSSPGCSAPTPQDPPIQAMLDNARQYQGTRDKSYNPIVQDWVCRLGLRHQGTLMTAIRGCDTVAKHDATKALVRVYRAHVLVAHCKDPERAKSFIEVVPHEEIQARMIAIIKSHDHYPHHYMMHLVHAASIIGYKHPDDNVRSLWEYFYRRMTGKFHMFPETEKDLDNRLNADEDTFAKAQ